MEQLYLDKLKNNMWFNTLAETFQNFILKKARLLYLEKNQHIFHTGDSFNGIYAVLDGSVYLGHTDQEGSEAIIAFANPIMWFGEISLIDQKPRSHDAITIHKSVLLHIYSKDLELLLHSHPIFWFHVAQLTAQKLRITFLELASIQTQSISQRIAQRLLFILNGYGNHIKIENNVIHLSQEQLAHMLVCSRQTINQELQKLERLGVLKVSFKKIEIMNYDQLNNIALPTHKHPTH